MDVKDKKKKLTLKNFSGGAAAISSYAKGSGNKSVLVEKKKNRSIDINQSVEKPKISLAPEDIVKAKTLTKEDTAKAQKSAQEWARKKIQEELEIDNSKKLIKKTHGKKREYKLTLSKALTDADEDEKTRSLASFKRAREKEKKLVQENDDSAVEVKKVSREISVPNLITIQELANRMAEKASAIIKFLFEKNVKVTINHTIDRDTAEYIVGSFGHKVVKDNQIDDELSKLKKS
ncbi:MAG: translation initiation factor IF-2, partial [Candidatus Fonsibacter lacus]|nr:translation initiation factor IF-2 [Candidatus Fonsibacter lacus]